MSEEKQTVINELWQELVNAQRGRALLRGDNKEEI